MTYLHPISGALVLALLGLRRLARPQAAATPGAIAPRSPRATRAGRASPTSRCCCSWLAGVASVLLGRDDLTFAASLHFRSGTALALLLTGSALTGRAMERGADGARDWHIYGCSQPRSKGCCLRRLPLRLGSCSSAPQTPPAHSLPPHFGSAPAKSRPPRQALTRPNASIPAPWPPPPDTGCNCGDVTEPFGRHPRRQRRGHHRVRQRP